MFAALPVLVVIIAVILAYGRHAVSRFFPGKVAVGDVEVDVEEVVKAAEEVLRQKHEIRKQIEEQIERVGNISELEAKILYLRNAEHLSVRKIAEKLREEGYSIGKTKVWRILKELSERGFEVWNPPPKRKRRRR